MGAWERESGRSAPENPWVEAVAKALEPWRGGAVVVAVSGGADSVALLLASVEAAGPLDLRLSVACLDHGARGEASADDARFVADLAGRLGLPCDLGRWRPERPAHFEADARRARYAWLAEVAQARIAGAVAVGHTRDDQAETVLQRLLRGTGPRGLAGIPERRPLAPGVDLVRPLLHVDRESLRDHLRRIGQPWREDPTNLDPSKTRARIRLDLLPRLARDYNPQIREALARLAGLLADQNHAWDDHVANLIHLACQITPDGRIRLNYEKLSDSPDFVRTEVCRAVWRRAGWPEASMDARRWRRLAALLGTRRGRLDLGGGYEAVAAPEALWLVPPNVAVPPADPPDPEPLPIPGSVIWGRYKLSAISGGDNLTPTDETIDRDRLEPFGTPEAPHLLIRSAGPGDRLDPLGLSGRTKPLADVFRARRIGRADRPGIPLVCDRLGIVWVVGVGIAERVRLVEATRRTLALRASAAMEGCD